MKEDLINLIRKGQLQDAFSSGESFLKKINEHYYSWITLQSRFNDKNNENIKGLLKKQQTQ